MTEESKPIKRLINVLSSDEDFVLQSDDLESSSTDLNSKNLDSK